MKNIKKSDLEYMGTLISGDFEDNTMTFQIHNKKMILQSGKYYIVRKKEEGMDIVPSPDHKENVWIVISEGNFEKIICFIVGLALGSIGVICIELLSLI